MQRNLLLITFDQARGDWCDPGNNFVDLSTLKLLGDHGYKYERCYTTSPQCVPARLSWLTGKMPSTIGVTKNIKCNTRNTMPSVLRRLNKAGWYVEIIGKTHWTAHTHGVDLQENVDLMNALGIDKIKEIGGPRALRFMKCELTEQWQKEGWYRQHINDMDERYGNGRTSNSWLARPTLLPNSLYPDIWIADEAIKAIKMLPVQRPWVIWVSFVGPHEPFDTPEEWKGGVNENLIPQPLNNDTWIDELDEKIELKKNRQKWDDTFDDQERKRFRADYANNLKLLDDQILRILDAGFDHNQTDIMVTSDHGEMLGDYNMLYKSTFLEPAIRVPMIISNLGNGSPKAENLKAVTNSTRVIRNVLRTRYRGELIDKAIRDSCKSNRTTIEFASERCFINGDKKLVMDQSGNILWGTKLLDDSIKEIYVDSKEIKESKANNWEKTIMWAKKNNDKLNNKTGYYARHLDFL